MLDLGKEYTVGQLLDLANKTLKEQLTAVSAPAALLPDMTLKGDASLKIKFLTAADEAKPASLTFAVDEKFLEKALLAGASAIIVPPSLSGKKINRDTSFLIFPEARMAFCIIMGLLLPQQHVTEGEAHFVDKGSVELAPNVFIGAGAYIGRNVKIGQGSSIGPLAYIDDGVEIGAASLIHPKVVLRCGTKVGNNCQIHSGAVIGGDGFGYTQIPWAEGGRLLHFKNEHRGGVIIEDEVEIGSNATIDRGLVADTIIGQGSKIDNLVQVGHNCRIGRDCIVVSQVGLGGHSLTGDRVFLLGQSGLGPGVSLGDDVIISAQSGLGNGSLPSGRRVWMGTPVKTMEEFHQNLALSYRQLPKLRKFFQLLKKANSFSDLKNAFFAPAEKVEKVEKVEDD